VTGSVPPVTRKPGVEVILCPIPTCPWGTPEPALPAPEFLTSPAMRRALVDQAQRLEDRINAHLRTHSTLEWVQGVIAARSGEAGRWKVAVTEAFGPAAAEALEKAVDAKLLEAAVRRAEGVDGG
jgi:hypothetical protein